MPFVRTETDTLVPTLLAYPDRVECLDGRPTRPVTLGNSLKVAFDVARSDAGEVIGVFAASKGVTIGDGKGPWYPDSVNKPEGVRGIQVLGLSADTRIDGSIVVQNRPSSSDVNGWLGFHRLELHASPYAYAIVQTFMQHRPTYGLEVVECGLVPDLSSHHNTYSHIRCQGRAQLSVRKSKFVKGVKEHGGYFDNWCDDSEFTDNDFELPGRCAVQATNRIDQGPPQVGHLRIERNTIQQPLDAFAITVAGQSDPNARVVIADNTIAINGDVDGDGVHDWGTDSTAGGIIVYREGADVTLPVPKLGAWPVGSTGSEGYSVTNLPSSALPCINHAVLRGNRITGLRLKKQLVAVGSCRLLRVGDRSLFVSDNRPALEINHQGKVHKLELTFGASYRGWRAQGKIIDRTNPFGVALSDAQIDALQVAEPSTK